MLMCMFNTEIYKVVPFAYNIVTAAGSWGVSFSPYKDGLPQSLSQNYPLFFLNKLKYIPDSINGTSNYKASERIWPGRDVCTMNFLRLRVSDSMLFLISSFIRRAKIEMSGLSTCKVHLFCGHDPP